ncbi:hypothetical protein ACH42_01610 [Endozoicomonas sp. (ex Bugula neritina AB1)]|nr:hypothetical protein ACH42_01610 [Endozoicomonas sp. (ex Bugula neritina AB1)]
MIRGILQLLLLPLYIPFRLLYANVLRLQYAKVLYSWYRNKKEFDAVSIDNETPGTLKTWEQWQEGAKEMEEDCAKRNQVFVKIVVRPEPLRQWLKENQLDNSAENRERYIHEVYKVACEQGIELPGRRSLK